MLIGGNSFMSVPFSQYWDSGMVDGGGRCLLFIVLGQVGGDRGRCLLFIVLV